MVPIDETKCTARRYIEKFNKSHEDFVIVRMNDSRIFISHAERIPCTKERNRVFRLYMEYDIMLFDLSALDPYDRWRLHHA